MTLFSSQAWKNNQDLYNKICHMPFNQELAKGTLHPDQFRHYVIQDAHYLIAFGKALAVAAAKADDPDEFIQFCDCAKVAVIVERSLHDGFMKQFGISPERFLETPLSPVSHHYTSYLLATAWSESYPVVLASLLPCFWIYAEVGRFIYAQPAVANNPYQNWINTYAGEEFHATVQAAIASVNRAAAGADARTVEKMHAAFTKACELEWMFWDSAYQQSQWPV